MVHECTHTLFAHVRYYISRCLEIHDKLLSLSVQDEALLSVPSARADLGEVLLGVLLPSTLKKYVQLCLCLILSSSLLCVNWSMKPFVLIFHFMCFLGVPCCFVCNFFTCHLCQVLVEKEIIDLDEVSEWVLDAMG